MEDVKEDNINDNGKNKDRNVTIGSNSSNNIGSNPRDGNRNNIQRVFRNQGGVQEGPEVQFSKHNNSLYHILSNTWSIKNVNNGYCKVILLDLGGDINYEEFMKTRSNYLFWLNDDIVKVDSDVESLIKFKIRGASNSTESLIAASISNSSTESLKNIYNANRDSLDSWDTLYKNKSKFVKKEFKVLPKNLPYLDLEKILKID